VLVANLLCLVQEGRTIHMPKAQIGNSFHERFAMAATAQTIDCKNGDSYEITIIKDANNGITIVFRLKSGVAGSEWGNMFGPYYSPGSKLVTHPLDATTKEVVTEIVGTGNPATPIKIRCPQAENVGPIITIFGPPQKDITLPATRAGHKMQDAAVKKLRDLDLP
jgi:hypothetical protein